MTTQGVRRRSAWPWLTFVAVAGGTFGWWVTDALRSYGLDEQADRDTGLLGGIWLVMTSGVLVPLGSLHALAAGRPRWGWVAHAAAGTAGLVCAWVSSLPVALKLWGDTTPVRRHDLESALLLLPQLVLVYVGYVVVLRRVLARRRRAASTGPRTADVERPASTGGLSRRVALHHAAAAAALYPAAVLIVCLVRGVGAGSGHLQLLSWWPWWIAGLALALPAALAEDTAVRAGLPTRAAACAWLGTGLVALASLWPVSIAGQPPTTDDVWGSVVTYAVLLGGHLVLVGVSSRRGRPPATV